MTLDSRDFFTTIVSFLFRRIRIFNALGVHYAKACFLFPTIVGTDLSNYFFLTLDQVCSLFPPSLRSRFESRNKHFSTSGNRSVASSIDSRSSIHIALRKIHHIDRVFSALSSFLLS